MPFIPIMKRASKTPLLVIFLLFSLPIFAVEPEVKFTGTDYVAKYKDDAIREMETYDIPASITLGQGMIESNYGNSELAKVANNHFGIKCHEDWTGETYTMNDDEPNECFRKYPTVLESFADHSKFLKSRQRYDFLFDLKITDYKGWAKGLKDAGYATDPTYADRLIAVIEQYKLYTYDKNKSFTAISVASDPASNDHPSVVESGTSVHEVRSINNSRYVVVKPGDTFEKIANEFEITVDQLHRCNDLDKDAKLEAGDILFIQSKRGKSFAPSHVVVAGETLHDISQKYGVRMKSLYKYNHLSVGTEPKVGDTVLLRKKRK
jgi:LysM repeat protein